MKKQVKKQPIKNGKGKSGVVIAGFILSIVAISTSLFGFGFIIGIPGLVCSIVGRSKSTDPLAKKQGTRGMIMSIVAIAVGIIMTIVWITTIAFLLWKFVWW